MDPTSWASALPSSSLAALVTAKGPMSATMAIAPPLGRVALLTACKSLDSPAIPVGRFVTLSTPYPWIMVVVVTSHTCCCTLHDHLMFHGQGAFRQEAIYWVVTTASQSRRVKEHTGTLCTEDNVYVSRRRYRRGAGRQSESSLLDEYCRITPHLPDVVVPR